jgi:hypothetical protein|tara:strand:+ start:1432 stop:4881 length:3450 start_codon:yes stop_codon:yes gene_type:complete
MTQMSLPNGTILDFEDASQDQIKEALTRIKEEQPELFVEQPEPKRLDLGTASLAEIRESAGIGPESDEIDFQPSNPGEVEDLGFQFFYGRADVIEEKAKRLEHKFGPGSYQQVEGTDKFVLLLDSISPELKKDMDLPETGTIWVNEPGFSVYDVAAFGGAEAAPMATALGAGLIFSGIGLVPGMILMAGAGAGGKAFDEFVVEDRLEKMNTQTDDEVYGDVALTGAFYGLGEGLGRGVWALGRGLLKGPGAKPDAARIGELVAGGMGRTAATRIAREEAKTQLRGAVKAGARPPVAEVSQKAILGRMQSIYEGIFPNAAAAEKNLNFVKDTLARLGAGEIDDAAAKTLLSRQSETISAQVANAMKNANVNESVRLANQHLQKVIDNEFKVLLDLYNPNMPLLTGWRDTAGIAARLFEQDRSILYKKSEDLLKGVIDAEGNSAATFSAKPLQRAVAELKENQARVAVMGDAFDKGLFSYINSQPRFTLSELTNLKSALRSVGKDPALVPGMNDAAIGTLVRSIDDTIHTRLATLAKHRSQPMPVRPGQTESVFYVDNLGNVGAGWNSATNDLFESGVMAWKQAQNFSAKGIQRFKSFSEDLLAKNISAGVTISNREVLQAVVREGQPDALLRYLKSVTPSGKTAEGIQAISANVFDDAARAANNGQFKRANQILDDAGVSPDIVKRLPAFAEKLGIDDPYGRMIASEFSDTIRDLGKMAQARANPLQFRNRVRDSLAREWLDQSYVTSQVAGEFSPSVFASRFTQLGDGLQNAMFGKKNATAFRELMNDYHKVGMSNKKFATATGEALGATAGAIRARAMGLTGGRSISDEITNVQAVLREAERQSRDDLFQAFAKGKIDDADSLVLNILKNPGNYDRLVREFGAKLDGPAGVKDMVMGRIMESAFPQGILPDVISSGAWGAPMRRAITNLNRNGALAKVLGDGDRVAGQRVVNDLMKASKVGERISDAALKGKQGLASAAFAAGAGMRLITNPLAFAGEAVGIFAMGRIMRQKWFLNSLLKPRYSAGLFGLSGGRRLLQKGRRVGADLQDVSPLGLELRERVAQEGRMVAASLLEQGIGPETREGAQELAGSVREAINTGDFSNISLPSIVTTEEEIRDVPQDTNPYRGAVDTLRQIEQNKLLGVPATQ